MPNPDRRQKIKEIVGAALEHEPSQRSAFLDQACSHDSALRAEVDSLLSAYDGADSLSTGGQTTALGDVPTAPKSIGPYQLVQKLGEGGMGQVWLAEQTSPVRRKVALKLIKAGMYDDSVLRRFQTERQSLAIMDHPAIAKVFDAGATLDGQPYFVMEYVSGISITQYCDNKKLKIRDRLELFIHACEGVQHAHQKALIHRDLKPANILVVEVDGKPQPRIIDFGLAKSLTPYFAGDLGQTRFGALVGTPGYMSPEQADPGSLDVDTRADVYSLGVILYELLTGSLPFDPSILKDLRFEEMLRHLREDEPLRPSTKVSSSRDASSPLAAARSTQPNQLASLLRGDLDWITLKALDKDRNRRYGSPSDLAADLSRYLHNQPVIARPASPGYVVRKYVRRHRYAVAFASTLVLLLAGFAILQAIQLRRITRERDRANRALDRANRITDFMTGMFRVSDPREARGNTLTAREVLDKASKDIDTGLAKDPQVQAQLMYIMGYVYDELGLFPTSESLFSRAVDIRIRVLGPRNPDTLDAEAALGAELWRLGRIAEAEKLLREALSVSRKELGPSNKTTITLASNLSLALADERRYADAESLAREALENNRRAFGPENENTIRSLYLLCALLGDEGKYAESEKLNLEVLDISRRILGPDHPATITAMVALGDTLMDEGHYSEAEKQFQETLEISRRVNGPNHPNTAGILYSLANIAALRGMPDRALLLLRDSVDAGLRQSTALMISRSDAFRSFHGNAKFEKIVADAEKRAAHQRAAPQKSQ
jgi:serine/threonine protein kinase